MAAQDRVRYRESSSSMETLIGYILLVGVVLSIVLIAAGLIWHWLTTGRSQAEYVIRGTNLLGFAALTVHQLVSGSLDSRTIINLGIVILLLTPFVRVLASVIYFALAEHNWKYVVFTALVLSILTYSLFLR